MSEPSGPSAERLNELRADALDAVAKGEFERAADRAGQVLASFPQDVVAAQALCHALLMLNRPREAVERLHGPAASCDDRATETLFARALARAGRRDEALEQLKRTAARRPAFVLAFVELGELLAEAGRVEEALAVLSSGLDLSPATAVLRVALGHLHLRLNDRARARALFDEVRAAAPLRVDARVGLARVLELEGDYAGAVELYRSALQTRPEATTQIRLGRCLLELGEREAGEAALQAAASASAHATGLAIAGLAAAPRGRIFLRPSAAASFLRAGAR
jgi:tetratricopeptide (TPR) repeat protein